MDNTRIGNVAFQLINMIRSFVFLFFLFPAVLTGQVEVEKPVKLTEIATDNELSKLLGRQVDGTLAERDIADFIINYFLGLPNGIVTLVNAGESFENLITAGATTTEILNSGLFGPCDDGLSIDSDDPLHAAYAIGMCYGLVAAEWLLPDGSAPPVNPNFSVGHGVLSSFGTNVNPQQGNRILALSTGTARAPSDAGYQADLNKGYLCNRPAGFPYVDPVCPQLGQGQDGIALKVSINVPSFATGFTFDYKYYTHDFPGILCTSFVDQPAVIVNPVPGGSVPPGNLLYDSSNVPVNANSQEIISFCTSGGTGYACPNGTSELNNTGFEVNGASEWITVSNPATGNTMIDVTFTIWDSGDGQLTSTLLIDNWLWTTD